ncbi:HTH CENPB-type domain-containing protein [Trichonephila clavipes]|nr:HTH CENPB-type domain-containing protein [Trichonephila clavipes]
MRFRTVQCSTIVSRAAKSNGKIQGGLAAFKASTGWLKNFKSHHGIRELQIAGESLSGDKNSANKFKETFLQHVEEEGYSRDDVYSIDETGRDVSSSKRTALVQPMDQDVIEKLKRMYRKQVLWRLLLPENDEESGAAFAEKLNMKDACYMLDEVWD